MQRLQLIEIHEQAWCPAAIRNGATDCLNLFENVGQQYRHTVPLLAQALAASHSARIVDLCSGGGGPWFTLSRQLRKVHPQPVQILLTDRYPSETAMQTTANFAPDHLRYLATPVDATQVPPELTGFRTLFTAFHHFPPHTARAILQNAVDHKQGIAIFEQTRRNPFALLFMLTLPFLALLTVPFMRPFRWSRLFWTYIIPAIPCVLGLDGIVSCLRTYSERELTTFTEQLQAPGYTWKIGHLPSPLSPIGVIYALGYPTDRSPTSTNP